jgi:hypothetical protein
MRFSRTTIFALAVALAPAAAFARQQPPAQPPAGQQPPAQQPPAQQPPAQQQAPQGRFFTGDAGMIFNIIKPDHTADFELVMNKLKEALAKSPDPKRRQQAASWKVFKGMEPAQGGNVLYIFFADPAMKDVDYTVTKILSEAFPSEVQDLYKKYVESYAGGQSLANFQLLVNMAGAPAAGGK